MSQSFRLIFACLLACFSAFAHAAFPIPGGSTVYYFPPQQTAAQAGTLAATCPAWVGVMGSKYVYVNISPPAGCLYTLEGRGPYTQTASSFYQAGTCPAGSTAQGGQCVCSSGYIQSGNSCVPHNPDKDVCWNFAVTGTLPGGDLVTNYRYTGTVADGQEFCLPVEGLSSPSKGCKVKFNRDALLNYGDGVSISEGTLSMAPDSNTVDQSCDRSPSKDPPQKEKCPNGFSGTVNGEQRCINKVPDSGVGNNDEEETTETETETRRVTRNSTTECKNGVCTTTTTTTTTVTTKPGGATTTSTSTTTSSGSQAGFCKENPGTKICSDGDDKGIGDVGSVTGGRSHGQPTLYETKYPDGIKGVWDDSGIAGADGKFGQLASALMPGIGDSNGACLSFTVPLSVGIVDFGVLDVSPPCLIWPFIRICVLITALWLARALIFGG